MGQETRHRVRQLGIPEIDAGRENGSSCCLGGLKPTRRRSPPTYSTRCRVTALQDRPNDRMIGVREERELDPVTCRLSPTRLNRRRSCAVGSSDAASVSAITRAGVRFLPVAESGLDERLATREVPVERPVQWRRAASQAAPRRRRRAPLGHGVEPSGHGVERRPEVRRFFRVRASCPAPGASSRRPPGERSVGGVSQTSRAAAHMGRTTVRTNST
jgi:hypothetical protein